MKTYQVVLTKSYAVAIKAETKEKAKRFAELYTGNIQNISTERERKRSNFLIEEIDCKMNESLEAEEIEND